MQLQISPIAAPSQGIAALNASSCTSGFTSLLARYQLVQSTLGTGLWYFLAQGTIPGSSLSFCLADLSVCGATCLDVLRFWSATDTGLAGMCQMAGLA